MFGGTVASNIIMPSFQVLKGQGALVVLVDLHLGSEDCAGGVLAIS